MEKEPVRERRSTGRNAASIDVQFHIHDAQENKSLTRKVPGRLTNLSAKGACLHTDRTLIDGYHLMLNDDLEGGTPLVLALPTAGEEAPFEVKARVLWYKRLPAGSQFHFSVGVKFLDLGPGEKKQMENLIRQATTPPKA